MKFVKLLLAGHAVDTGHSAIGHAALYRLCCAKRV